MSGRKAGTKTDLHVTWRMADALALSMSRMRRLSRSAARRDASGDAAGGGVLRGSSVSVPHLAGGISLLGR